MEDFSPGSDQASPSIETPVMEQGGDGCWEPKLSGPHS